MMNGVSQSTEEPPASSTAHESIQLSMNSVRAPGPYDKVYKDECSFSFDTPESPGGLYTNMNSWQSFGEDYVDLDHERTGNVLYLHQKWTRVALPKDKDTNENPKSNESKPTRLAFGVPGGFQAEEDNFSISKEQKIVVMPTKVAVPYPCVGLPSLVSVAAELILEHKGYAKTEALAAFEEMDERKESKYARNLVQLPTGKKISPDPKSWRCEESGATDNLWLNLSTGYIGSGRRNWDGSGGTGAALRNYEETGRKYPLVVKLGTITPNGADVFSYAPDENDMVIDPLLGEHLAHWGINMQSQVQTSKTMAEMQIDLNTFFEFNALTESGASLTPLSGPGYIGLVNLGNSCYMNSIVQLLASLPAFEALYYQHADSIFRTAPEVPMEDHLAMLAKLFVGLLSDRYTKKSMDSPEGVEDPDPGARGCVRPTMFKAVVAQKHPEFSSSRQQDVMEYFQHLLDTLGPAERRGNGTRYDRSTLNTKDNPADGGPNMVGPQEDYRTTAGSTDEFKRVDKTTCLPFDYFRFVVENRIQCAQSRGVKYQSTQENILELPIPMERAVKYPGSEETETNSIVGQQAKKIKTSPNATKGDDPDERSGVHMQVPFEACLETYFASEVIEGFWSSATRTVGKAEKSVRLRSFPEYLVVCMKRYYIAEDWTPKKLEVRVDVPEMLDLSRWRARGIQDDETPLPEAENIEDADGVTGKATKDVPEMDPAVIKQIVAMGFSENGARRAVATTDNSGVESALQWVFAHSEDADFNDPFPAEDQSTAKSSSMPGISPESAQVNTLVQGMGFPKAHAIAALKESGGDVARATEWLFSHADNIEEAIAAQAKKERETAEPSGTSRKQDPTYEILDGSGKYELVGFASHMGKNTSCGHYVAHIKKEGRFVLYNDEKVAESKNPPKDLGYLYVFKRRTDL